MGKDSLSSVRRNVNYKAKKCKECKNKMHEKLDSKIDAATFANQADDENEIEKVC